MASPQLVEAIISEYFGLKPASVEAIGRAWNNDVFGITFANALEEPVTSKVAMPETIPIPVGTTRIIIRIAKADACLNEEVRIQNQVATAALLRDALSKHPPKLIADSYAWKASNKETGEMGWIVEEFMEGEPFNEIISKIDKETQQRLVVETAAVFKTIQDYNLPSTIKGYGGLNFDTDGNIVVGATAIPCGGPFDSLEAMYKQLYKIQLELADGSELIKGWKAQGDLRSRLDKFIANGISEITSKIPQRPTLVHGDFGFANILVDPKTYEMSALIDFDFASIASPLDEYFYSFFNVHGLFISKLDTIGDESAELLRQRHLHGFPTDPTIGVPVVPPKPEGQPPHPDDPMQVDWELAKMWDDELAKIRAVKPSTLNPKTDAEAYADLYWMGQTVCAPYMLIQRILNRSTPEQLAQKVAKEANKIDVGLTLRGY